MTLFGGRLEDEVDYFGLLDEEVGLGFEDFAHFYAVEGFVALGAGGPDGGAAGGVEETELDAGGVGYLAHDSAKGVDLADEMAFGDAADGWVAAHLGDEVEVEGEDGGAEAHARGGHGGFASCVAGAYYYYVELFGKASLLYFRRSRVSRELSLYNSRCTKNNQPMRLSRLILSVALLCAASRFLFCTCTTTACGFDDGSSGG